MKNFQNFRKQIKRRYNQALAAYENDTTGLAVSRVCPYY
jgi:ABC-type transporter MlaC component